MTPRRRLHLYLLALHAALLGSAWPWLNGKPLAFVAAELGVLFSGMVGWRLLRQAQEPADATRRFRDLLQDGQYAARLQAPGSPETDELVALFNRLLTQLHDERLKLGEQQGFLDKLLEATPSAVVVFDFDGRVSLRNASAQALLGEPQAGGVWAALDLIPPGDSRLLTDAAGRRLRAQRGRFFDRGFPREFLLVEELTEELARSERATYDKLVRVLAHEINNTVAATRSVLGSLAYYREQLREGDREDFATAIAAVQHRNASLGDFIERFTRVAKMPEPELHPLPVLAVLESTARLYLDVCAAHGITVEWTARDASLVSRADRALLEQALVNILKNAVEAVQARLRDEPGHPARLRLAVARDDDTAQLSVSDSANLLDDAVVQQLFTPFFSTKKGGQGIGLLFVREVMQRHGFAYRLAATPAGETRFDLWLPLDSP